MFKDISSAISLADTKNGSAPNFLLALGLCCYTEFWGRLTEGIPKDNEEACFYAFLDRLGYRTQRSSLFKPYRDIRNSLAHAYLDKDVAIRLRRGPCGIVFYQKHRKYTFYIRTFFDDFEEEGLSILKWLRTTQSYYKVNYNGQYIGVSTELDEIDLAIISSLMKDGRKSFRQIS
jgi:hypothetical protein